MPKIKTHRGAKKRFRITKKGKIKRSRAGIGHLNTKKSSKRKRRLGKAVLLNKVEKKRIKKLLVL